MSITGTSLGIFGGVAGLGVVAAAWKTIKLYASRVYGLFVIRVDVDGWPARRALMFLLWKEFKSSPLSARSYFAGTSYVQPTQRNQLVAFQNLPTAPTLFWRGWRPMMVSVPNNKDDNPGEAVHLSFIRGLYNPEKLMLEAVEKQNKRDSGDVEAKDRFYVRRYFGSMGLGGLDSDKTSDSTVPASGKGRGRAQAQDGYRPLGWKDEELGQPAAVNAIEVLALSAACLRAIEEARLWHKSERWYKERSIPWKRGWLLYGVTGTGKTAFCRALGQDLKMPICLFDLASMTNRDFMRSWEDTLSRCPCIALFEDLDTVFDGRRSVSEGGILKGLTFDCFLNTLDGVQDSDGVFVVITTNEIEKMDPAIGRQNGDMATRPGRIDRVIEMTKPDTAGRMKMAKRILIDYPEVQAQAISDGQEHTGAQFQEHCATLALRLRWGIVKAGDNGKPKVKAKAKPKGTKHAKA